MGTGDRSDPTTDFFRTHRAQCARYAKKLSGMSGTEDIVAKLNEAVAACDVAIAKGASREDMPNVVVEMPQILTKYGALAKVTRDTFEAAIRVDDATKPTGSDAKVIEEAAPTTPTKR